MLEDKDTRTEMTPPATTDSSPTLRRPARQRFALEYCRSCLTPNTRPNGHFNAEGICTACEFYGMDASVSYDARFAELKQIVNQKVRNHRNKRWQCIVGVSGGKDSTRQALWVREKLGINPLLVSVAYPPRQISPLGVENLSNLISLGFDTIALGPAPRLSRELVRQAFFRFGNWCKATEMALFSGVPQVAVSKNIKLILWGENPALQVGDLGAHGHSIWDGRNLVNLNTLAGGKLDWFEEVSKEERRLEPYRFPSRETLDAAKIETVFLGPAWRDWSHRANSAAAIVNGLNFRAQGPQDTADIFGTSMVDEDWTVVNMMLKYYKLGFSRATEQANALIRKGEITRAEGVLHAERYDAACSPEYLASFCRYIGVTETEFWEVVKAFAHPDLFDLSGAKPVPRFKVGHGYADS